MKRAGSPTPTAVTGVGGSVVDTNTSSAPPNPDAPPPFKRTKASKACLGCRHQKTRCDLGTTTADGGMKCKRCTHFNLHCSLEGTDPPPDQQLGSTTGNTGRSRGVRVASGSSGHGRERDGDSSAGGGGGRIGDGVGSSSGARRDREGERGGGADVPMLPSINDSFPQVPPSPPSGSGSRQKQGKSSPRPNSPPDSSPNTGFDGGYASSSDYLAPPIQHVQSSASSSSHHGHSSHHNPNHTHQSTPGARYSNLNNGYRGGASEAFANNPSSMPTTLPSFGGGSGSGNGGTHSSAGYGPGGGYGNTGARSSPPLPHGNHHPHSQASGPFHGQQHNYNHSPNPNNVHSHPPGQAQYHNTISVGWAPNANVASANISANYSSSVRTSRAVVGNSSDVPGGGAGGVSPFGSAPVPPASSKGPSPRPASALASGPGSASMGPLSSRNSTPRDRDEPYAGYSRPSDNGGPNAAGSEGYHGLRYHNRERDRETHRERDRDRERGGRERERERHHDLDMREYSPPFGGPHRMFPVNVSNTRSENLSLPGSGTGGPFGSGGQGPGGSPRVSSASKLAGSGNTGGAVGAGAGDPEPRRQQPLIAPPSPPLEAYPRDTAIKSTPLEAVVAAPSHGWGNRPPINKHWPRPLSFMRDLVAPNAPHQTNATPIIPDLVSQHVVSAEDAEVLSQIWSKRYAPWLVTEQPSPYTTGSQSPAPNSLIAVAQQSYKAPTSPFLQAAQWTLAARHLPTSYSPSSPSTYMGGLHAQLSHKQILQKKLIRVLGRAIYRTMLGLDCSPPAVRALLILAQWANKLPYPSTRYPDNTYESPPRASASHTSPKDDPGEPSDDASKHKVAEINGPLVADDNLEGESVGNIPYDGELFLTTAVHLAAKMHLEGDVLMALAQKAEYEQAQRQGQQAALPTNFGEVVDRARLMFQVSVIDGIIRFGKGRDTSSRVQLHLAEELFGSPSTLITQPHGAADARLVLQCHMLDSALRMKELCQYADDVLSMGIELWLSRAAREFKVMGQWQHRLAPVFALSDPTEAIQNASLTMQYQFYRLTLFFTTFRTFRNAFPDIRPFSSQAAKSALFRDVWASSHRDTHTPPIPPSGPQDITNSPEMQETTKEWIWQSRECAESMMIEALTLRRVQTLPEITDGETVLPPLAYAPDHMCWITLFAPVFIVRTQLMGLELESVRSETTRTLLDRVVDMFREASPTPLPASVVSMQIAAAMAASQKLRKLSTTRNEDPKSAEKRAHTDPIKLMCPAADETKPTSENEPVSEATLANPPPTSTACAIISPELIHIPLTIRCAGVLTGLLKLWDTRARESAAREAVNSAAIHVAEYPEKNGKSFNTSSTRRSGAGTEEEEDELASDKAVSPRTPQALGRSSSVHPPTSSLFPSPGGDARARSTDSGGVIQSSDVSALPNRGTFISFESASVPASTMLFTEHQQLPSSSSSSSSVLPAAIDSTGYEAFFGTAFNFDLGPFYDSLILDPFFASDFTNSGTLSSAIPDYNLAGSSYNI